MGFKDLFSKRSGSRAERQTAKAAKKLMNKHIQTGDRKRSIDILESIGTTAAAKGLLGRFTYRTDVQIVDEDEKELVHNAIMRLGPQAIPALREYIHEELAIYWPLRALTEIGGEDMAVKVLLEEIAGITENYDRDVARKNELVSNLREYRHPEVLQTLVGLLGDEDEETKILAVDGLSVYEPDEVIEYLVPLLMDENETQRVRFMILDLFVEGKWNVKRFRRDLTPHLPDLFWIDGTGIIQRK